MQRIFSMELAGRTITAETGKYAEQAGGSLLMRCGDTAVLVCATVAKAPREGEWRRIYSLWRYSYSFHSNSF